MKQTWQLLIGLLISAVFIYLALPGLHLSEVTAALRTANYWWILPGILVYFAGLWARSWRWHYTLRHLKTIPLRRLYPLICIGYFGNNVYPFRAGEVIRSYVLKQQEDVPISSSLATVLIERVFDGLVMLLFVFLALPFAPALPATYRNLVVLLTVLLLGATVVFVWMATQPIFMARVYGWCSARLLPTLVRPKIDAFYERFMVGLHSLSSRYDVLMIFGTSIIIWLMETVKYWFVMHAFEFQVSFLVLMLMNGLVNLATTLPSAPGYIGTFDTPGIETLAAFGVERNLAASYTFTLHAALWLPVTLVGAYYFWRAQLHWADFTRAQAQSVNS
ncbi:MAG TPA: lysylphosphatidylglycerol synthase transmembrane domain-containing protein [Caldilineaceae bacterium]|nr:lysylphosphatidylglycerol synthase transmembrane domain-containing protein [Caldilineaceae bacterium]